MLLRICSSEVNTHEKMYPGLHKCFQNRNARTSNRSNNAGVYQDDKTSCVTITEGKQCAMSRVAIYCRLSEEDKEKRSKNDDSGSIQNQKAMLLQYSFANNWEVFSIYSDDNYTGSDRNRPEFNRMLTDAQARKFDIILCKSQSRFTREMELVEKYIHGLFPVWGIRFISVVDNADTNNLGNKKSRQINGLVNEWMLEDMSESIRSVLNTRREMGMHIGSFALYGYKKDPDQKGHLIIDDEAAETVREVFSLFAQGYGKTMIARILNERGVPNPAEYKRLHGLRYKQPNSTAQTLWKYSAISHMLTNEIYIGNMVQGKYGSVSYKSQINRPRPKELWYRKEDTHEAIIDRDLWNRVQAIIQSRTKPFSDGTIGLFARKVCCASCGYIMRSSKNRGRHYLQCTTHRIAPDACPGAFISVELLECAVLSELRSLAGKYLNTDVLSGMIEWKNTPVNQLTQLEKERDTYCRKSDECSECIKALYRDKVQGHIAESDYFAMYRDFSAEKQRYEHLIDESNARIATLISQPPPEDHRKSLIEQYTNPEHLTREMVDILIDYISVGKRVPGTNDVPIEIHWKF